MSQTTCCEDIRLDYVCTLRCGPKSKERHLPRPLLSRPADLSCPLSPFFILPYLLGHATVKGDKCDHSCMCPFIPFMHVLSCPTVLANTAMWMTAATERQEAGFIQL
jgi:hypothetical protein